MDELTKCAIEIGSRWEDMHTKFHDNGFGHLSNITVDTATI
jgi:hypothetical protein